MAGSANALSKPNASQLRVLDITPPTRPAGAVRRCTLESWGRVTPAFLTVAEKVLSPLGAPPDSGPCRSAPCAGGPPLSGLDACCFYGLKIARCRRPQLWHDARDEDGSNPQTAGGLVGIDSLFGH